MRFRMGQIAALYQFEITLFLRKYQSCVKEAILFIIEVVLFENQNQKKR